MVMTGGWFIALPTVWKVFCDVSPRQSRSGRAMWRPTWLWIGLPSLAAALAPTTVVRFRFFAADGDFGEDFCFEMEKGGHWWKIYCSSTKIQKIYCSSTKIQKIYCSSTKIQKIYCSYCRLFNQKYQRFTRSSVAGGLPRLHLDSHALETG